VKSLMRAAYAPSLTVVRATRFVHDPPAARGRR
jgi:hypothetical protein